MTVHIRALRDRIVTVGGGLTERRNRLILADTSVTALTGLALLIGSARALTPAALSSFALAQLIAVTSVGILRPAFYSAALAAQRTTGPATVPLRWAVTIAQPAALVVTVVIILLVRTPDGPQWWFSVALAVGVYLGQDAVRNVMVSRSQPAVALLADISTGALVLGGVVLIHSALTSPSALMLLWGAAGLPGLAFTVVRARRGAPADAREQTLAETWRLGRWGAADAGLAAVAALVPMIVSTALISPTASGTYRLLQTALGPLNILFTTVITVLTLDSWHTTSRAGLHTLRRRVLFILLVMMSGGLLYLPVALPAVVWVSGLKGPDVTHAAVVVGVVGLLTAASVPFVGAALALGRQYWGVGIRLVTVAIAIAVCVDSSSWVPWHDPIGVSMLGAAAVALVGWVGAYWVANRTEIHRLRGQPTTQEATSHRA